MNDTKIRIIPENTMTFGDYLKYYFRLLEGVFY